MGKPSESEASTSVQRSMFLLYTRSTVALEDTSEKAREVYFRRLNEMTPSERLGLGVALWEAADSVQRAAARLKYPDADEDEITFRVAVTRFGSPLAEKVYRKS